MDPNRYKEIDIQKVFERKLYKSLCVASSSSTYSICIEYMQKWFLSKFDNDYFKSVHIDGKHILDDARTMTELQKLKRLKPSLAIIPNMDLSFDNEKIDSYPYGIELYSAKAKFRDSFFVDKDNDVFLGIGMATTLMNFTFKVKVATRAAQLDLYKYMKMAFRVGYTQGEYVDMDFHIPYNLMVQLAHDTGFYIKDEKIVDITKFLNYINAHSYLPFTYKYRCINGKSEFFLRMNEVYVHINTPEITADDGELEGQLNTNYEIEMQSVVRFPSPAYYSYYSQLEHTEIKSTPYDGSNSMHCFTIKLIEIPEKNEKGWGQYLTTEYEENDLKTPLSIDFSSLFEGELKEIIDYTIALGLSPSLFLDIKIFNKDSEVTNKNMNWNTCTLTTVEPVKVELSYIAIYADLNYINNTSINLRKSKETRIN